MELNQEFLIEVFYSFCKRPIHKKYQNVFNAECPVCREGKSAGRSRRLFFFPHKNYFYCHNCSKSWRPFEWVREVTSWTFPEIVKKNKEKEENSSQVKKIVNIQKQVQKLVEIPSLPENSVDLTDPSQVNFFKENKYIKLALEYVEERRLFKATNRCKKLFVSLNDRIHKNRLIIPFYNQQEEIVCYQSRALTQNQFPKYLTKFGEKEIFSLNNVVEEIPYIFVFEGPIDSMFVKNGVAMASLSPTEKQIRQLNSFIGYEQIWVFDNDKNNQQTTRKIQKYIKDGKKIFIWPKEFAKFKDFNEICCSLELDEIPWKFVVKNSADGPSAMIKQKLMKISC